MEEPTDLIRQVQDLFGQKKYEEIISLLSDDILDHHKNASLYAWRAWAHNRMKDFQPGEWYANKAIEADPSNPFGFRQRGIALNRKGEFDKAIADLNKAIELDPSDPISYQNRSHIWFRKQEFDRSIADLNKVIELMPNDVDAYYNRSLNWVSKGAYDKAIADCDRTIELKPGDGSAYNNRGLIWFEKGNAAKAFEDYNKAIVLNPGDHLPYNNRGLLYHNQGKYSEAISDFNRAIELNPGVANFYRNRGNTWFITGEFQKAIEDYTNAVRLDPRFSFLENDIKLANEKLDERKTLETLKARQKDISEKIKLEDEIAILISRIRNLSRSKVKSVVHYTKMSVAEIYLSSLSSKMHYSNSIYMNDPMEGRFFFSYLDDRAIEEAYLNGEKRTESSVYLGSFLPAEEVHSGLSHEDELVMWRTYGKDEQGREAAGASIVISSDFFRMKMLKNEEGFSRQTPEELLNVVYIRKQKNKKQIISDSKKELEPALTELKNKLTQLIALKTKYDPKDDFSKEIENTVFRQLSTITYLFKSADYNYEHEVRIIRVMPKDSDLILSRGGYRFDGAPRRLYVESFNPILLYIKKIYLGPKVENHQQWSAYLDYELRKRVREMPAMTGTPLPYPLSASGLEIIRSECKFQ